MILGDGDRHSQLVSSIAGPGHVGDRVFAPPGEHEGRKGHSCIATVRRTSRHRSAGKTVRIEALAPGVRLLTLDRPHRLNAMSGELIRDLHRALDQVAADDECRVVVLTGQAGASAPG